MENVPVNPALNPPLFPVGLPTSGQTVGDDGGLWIKGRGGFANV